MNAGHPGQAARQQSGSVFRRSTVRATPQVPTSEKDHDEALARASHCSAMTRQLHLNLFIHGRGHHEAAWRHPAASPLALTDIRYYIDLAQQAEAGCFDSVFLADTLAAGEDIASAPRIWLEPLTALAALAGATRRIGLIATCSTTYTEPFNLARQFASLDHITGGRVGWNIVTTWLVAASANYGGEGQLSHAERYERAEEYMRVVTALWDSWTDDAVIDDRAAGVYARPGTIRPMNHRGTYYQVTGPLNVPRGPQGRPVFVQAGSSETGRRFAARHAEAVFTAQMEKATARDFYADLKRIAVAEGRDPGARADPAGPEPGDRRHRGGGATNRPRTERSERPGGGTQTAVRPVRRPRFLPSAVGQTAVAGGFP